MRHRRASAGCRGLPRTRWRDIFPAAIGFAAIGVIIRVRGKGNHTAPVVRPPVEDRIAWDDLPGPLKHGSPDLDRLVQLMDALSAIKVPVTPGRSNGPGTAGSPTPGPPTTRPAKALFVYEGHPAVPQWTWDEDEPGIRGTAADPSCRQGTAAAELTVGAHLAA